MTKPDDYVIRSVTIAEVLDADGERAITYNTEGDPADWDILGMLGYVEAIIRRQVNFPDDNDDD